MKSLIISLLLFIYSLSFAQIQWQENGVPVRQGENIAWHQSSVACDDETFVSIWTDTRNGIRAVYAQKVDTNGNKVWAEDGLLVNDESSRQENPVIIESGNGDVIIAWVDFRNEYAGDVYAQKISSNGVLQWAEEGVPLCLFEDIQISLNIVPDDNGGAYVIWLDSRNTGGVDIYGTHIDTNGNIVSGWADDGNPIASTSGYQNQHTFWEDGSNGAIVAWHDTRDSGNADIYMQRIASNGDLLWDENGNLLTGAVGSQEKPKITPDGTGNFIFSWRDRGIDTFGDIKAQRVDLNGNLLWANEVDVYVGEAVQRNARITKASDNGAIIVWEDSRNEISESYKDLYAQKLDINGNLQWNSSGIEIVQALYDQLNPRLIGDDNGGAWIIWEDCRVNNHPYDDIYLQHVNSNGTFELPVNGFDVCSADGWQFSPSVKLSENKVFCIWGDNRTGSTGLYVQLLDNFGNIILEENGEVMFNGLSGSIYDLQILQNEDNPIFLWLDNRYMNDTQIHLQILNNDGSNVFAEDGIPITTFSQNNQEEMDAVFGVTSGTIAVVWSENREGYAQIFAQGIDTSGNFIWSDSTGLKVAESTFHQDIPMISVKDNSGTDEYYIGLEDFTDFMNSQIKGQKIINGNLQWGEDGKVIADREYNDELTDIIENYYIWQSSAWNYENIFCLLVDENGDPAPGWSENGLEICVVEGMQRKARGIIVPQGLLIIWEDHRDGYFETDIYGQIVTPDGNILWQENGLPLIIQENDQVNFKFIYDDGLYVVWQDFRSGNNYEIYAQKFDMDGNELWQAGGVLVAGVDEMGYENPDLVKVGNTIFIVWREKIDYWDENIKAQLVSDNGELLWQLQGIIICDEIMDQKKPRVISNGEDDVYIAWLDGRSSEYLSVFGVYAQKVYIDPTSIENELISTRTELYPNYPNPFNPETTISFFTAENAENAELVIYNIKGQKVKTLVNEVLPAGEHSVVWDGKDTNNKAVASGIYFYNLKIGGKLVYSRKCLLLK